MKRYFWHYPGMVYAHNIWADNLIEAKQFVRNWLKVKRLPKGFAIWEG